MPIQAVKVPGKNLINDIFRGFFLASFTFNNSYRYTIVKDLPPGVYTVHSNTGLLIRLVNGNNVDYPPNYANSVVTFTHTGGDLKINLRFADTSDLGNNFLDINQMQLQLEKGAAATAYEPYKLTNPPSKLLKEWEYVKLDGSLEWKLEQLNALQYASLTVNRNFGNSVEPNVHILNKESENVLQIDNSATNFQDANNAYTFITYTNKIALLFPLGTFADIQGFKDFIAVNPYHLAYKLAKPERTTERKAYPSFFKQYEPKALQAPKGLYLDGTGYIQLPSMTMDAVEIDCVLDAVQVANAYILDARTGLIDGVIYNGSYKSGVGIFDNGISSFVEVDDVKVSHYFQIPKDKRIKLKAKSSNQFTDDVTIFARSNGIEVTKGTIYSIKCLLAGQVVATYNAEDLVGNVLHEGGKPKNLLPSFDSGKWDLHVSDIVQGLDVLESNVNSSKYIFTDFSPGDSFYIYFENNGKNVIYVIFNDDEGGFTRGSMSNLGGTIRDEIFVVPPNTKKISFHCNTNSILSKPQLYQVNPKNGQVVGGRVEQPKKARRILYAK